MERRRKFCRRPRPVELRLEIAITSMILLTVLVRCTSAVAAKNPSERVSKQQRKAANKDPAKNDVDKYVANAADDVIGVDSHPTSSLGDRLNGPVGMYSSRSEIISKLTHYYNKQDPPMMDRPTEVKLGIYVNSFYSFNEQTMDYAVSMYLRQAWRDPRLAYKALNPRIPKIRLGDNSWNDIWIPDTFLRNEKAATFHEVTAPNRLMTLTASGELWYVIKISATLSCPMQLQKYPLDTQACPMMFESFGYTMDTVYFSWLEKPVDIETRQLPQFKLEDTILYDCSQNYTAGAFPCLEIRFVLRRDIGYFLIQVYVPSVLIVILSWVSFWINVEASPARVSLGLLTVLTTTTMSGGARASLPRVSYIKALDVWMIVCLVFVFASLIEYAVVNVLSRRPARPQSSSSSSAATGQTPSSAGNGGSGVVASGGGVSVVVSGETDSNVVTVTGRRPLPQACAVGRSGAVCPKLGRLPVQNSLSVDESTTLKPPTETVGAGSRGWDSAARLVSSRVRRLSMMTSSNGLPLGTFETHDGKYKARRVDKFSRRAFPLSFLLFNIVYWVFYSFPTSDNGPADHHV